LEPPEDGVVVGGDILFIEATRTPGKSLSS
jgi:hypothetical protein